MKRSSVIWIFDGAMFPTGAHPLHAQHPNLPAGSCCRIIGPDCGDDGRDSWANVAPPAEPDFGRVSLIDASSFDDTKAYVSPRLAMLDDGRGDGGRYLPSAEPLDPGPAEFSNHGALPPGQHTVAVGARGWAAGERRARGPRDHDGAVGTRGAWSWRRSCRAKSR